MHCIYCGPDREPSSEHVIPYALGGRYTNSEIICRDCNSYFGTHVDCHITDWQLSLIVRNWFNLEGRGGGIPGYEVKAGDGLILTVGRKGTIRPKWRDVVRRENGEEFYFAAGTPTEDEARAAIDRIVAKKTEQLGGPPHIIERRVEAPVRRDWEAHESDVVYNYRRQGRAIAKMAFHYLATRLDRRFLSTHDFEPIKRFVRHGEHGRHHRLCQPSIPVGMESAGEPSIQHSLTLRCSRELRSAVCDVVLFGVLRYAVVLSYSYEGPDLFRSLVAYPLEERFDEGECSDRSPVPAKLILNVERDEQQSRYDRLEESVHRLIGWVDLYGFCHYVREALPGAITYASQGIPLGNSTIDHWLAAVADRFSDRSSPAALKHFLGEPSRLAAEILRTELTKCDIMDSTLQDSLEEQFSQLIYIRLLVDLLMKIVSQRVRAVDGARHI